MLKDIWITPVQPFFVKYRLICNRNFYYFFYLYNPVMSHISLVGRGSRGGEMGEFSPPPPFVWVPPFFFSYPSNIACVHVQTSPISSRTKERKEIGGSARRLLKYWNNIWFFEFFLYFHHPFEKPGSAPACIIFKNCNRFFPFLVSCMQPLKSLKNVSSA